ncbi:MAG: Oligopeptide-binding protein OppA [Chlamydiia bacterium]|nr:Oligopeptide-binding protein OppA [Chlamydiia bacterium]MCH9616387.1 Oligopeptide-binding protein OppA [Chlamydiia bacterium]MCH9629627.1 Oligopeptide-binding protein OppA [Chlamydiia bacterium]
MKLGKFALLACLIALVGCGKSKQMGATKPFRVNIAQEPQTLDSRKARNLIDLNVLRIVGDGLYRNDKSGKAHLSLASSVEMSNDQRTYTFKLRDAKWSNGDKVTAHDFVYTWKKILSPEFPSAYAQQLYVIKNARAVKENLLPMSMLGLTAIDQETLVVELSNPVPYFTDLLATPTFFPVNAKVDKANPSWALSSESYVSCGPFTMKEWKHNDQINFAKNPTYWDAAHVKLSALELYMVDQETEAKMFESGDLDWMGSPFSNIPVDEIEPARKKNKLITEPFLGTNWIRTNVTETPFDSPVVRKAFAMAVNRQALVEHVTCGNQIPSTRIVPLIMGLESKASFKDGDVETAREIFNAELEKYEMSVEKLPKITMKFPARDANQRLGQALQAQWKEALGVDVHLLPVEPKVFFDQVGKQDYQLAMGDWIADFDDAVSFLEVFHSTQTGTNNTGWENIDYMSSIDDSYKAKNVEERKALLTASENLILDELPIIPLFHKTMLFSKSDRVQNVVTTSLGGIDFKWADMEASHEKARR